MNKETKKLAKTFMEFWGEQDAAFTYQDWESHAAQRHPSIELELPGGRPTMFQTIWDEGVVRGSATQRVTAATLSALKGKDEHGTLGEIFTDDELLSLQRGPDGAIQMPHRFDDGSIEADYGFILKTDGGTPALLLPPHLDDFMGGIFDGGVWAESSGYSIMGLYGDPDPIILKGREIADDVPEDVVNRLLRAWYLITKFSKVVTVCGTPWEKFGRAA